MDDRKYVLQNTETAEEHTFIWKCNPYNQIQKLKTAKVKLSLVTGRGGL
jgi:hypothetical protein